MKKGANAIRIALAAAGAAGFLWFLGPTAYGVLKIGNLLGMIYCAILAAGAVFFGRIRTYAKRSKIFRAAYFFVAAVLCIGAVWAAAMSCCMYSASRETPPEDSTVIVLGSMVNGTVPSLDLQSRINTAQVYLEAHPNAKCIASGGQGKYESITEADAIKKSLTAAGIDPARILTEGSSANTQENLENSFALAKENGIPLRFAVVTDDYHEFRACSMARALGAEVYAVPAPTPAVIFSACWSREVVALAKYLLLPG